MAPAERVSTACPKCGQQLQAVALNDGQSAPYVCVECHLGFWNSELTAEARVLFRHRHNDFGIGAPARAVREAVEKERRGQR